MSRERPDDDRPQWHPSRRQMDWEWRSRQFMRFVVGPMVIGWELFHDNGHNLAVLLVGAMLASSADSINILRGLIAQAKFERRSLEDLIAQEVQEEEKEKQSSEEAETPKP